MSIAIALRLFLATLFARAAWHKLSQPMTFRAELSAYQLLPATFTLPLAYLLALTETFCSLLLFFFPPAISTGIALLGIYTLAIGINLWRGKNDIDCGCGAWLSPRKTLSWTLVWRNLLLIALAIFCLVLPMPQTFSLQDFFLGLLMAFTLWLLYEASEQAMGNAQRYQHWQYQHLQPGSTR